MKTMLALLGMMMVSGVAAGAQITKCVDKSGNVSYSAECPPGTRSVETGIKNAPASTPAPAGGPQQKSLAERDADYRKRQVEKQEADAKAQKKGAEWDQRRQACDQSRAYLKSLQEGQRIPRTDPKTGERSFMSDAEYPGEIAKAQRSIDANCK
jgi:hypothetical protein